MRNEDEPGQGARSEANGDAGQPAIDVAQIETEGLELAPFPAALPRDFRVIISEEADSEIRRHSLGDTSVELCGVLVGKLLSDGRAPFLEVTAAIAGTATRRSSSHVTFTHSTWEHVNAEMDSRFPEQRIVGWYHTHPGLGIFLSEMDRFIHASFFDMPYQVALVFDPLSSRRGLYAWHEGKAERLPHYWLAGELCHDSGAETERAEESDTEWPPPAEPAVPSDRPEATAPAGMQGWSVWATVTCVVAALAVFWFGAQLGARLGLSAEQSRVEPQVLSDLIRVGLFRDGLSAELDTVCDNLSDLHGRLGEIRAKLEAPAPGGEGGSQDEVAPAVLADIDEARNWVRATHADVTRVRKVYSGLDKLADRTHELLSASDDLRRLQAELVAQRGLLAQLCAQQARQILDSRTDDAHTARAQQFRDAAVVIAPEMRSQVDSLLPELSTAAPEEQAAE